jgi:O-antigen ligase
VGVLGLGGESGAPEKVLLVRANTGGGGPYGPFVNSNHFASAVELTVPAALVLFAVAARNLARAGGARQRAAVTALASSVAIAVSVGALMRSGSRGGLVFLAAGLVVTLPLWLRPWTSRRWPWVLGVIGLVGVAVSLAWTRIPDLRDDFAQLLVIEGVEGNTRWDLWSATLDSFLRSPLVGSGLGAYRFVIGLDKPATGSAILEQAHNDWLEWASTSGLIGIAALVLVVSAMVVRLSPRRVRTMRFELRYPLAGAAAALAATGLHEVVGFGLQTPLNGYLLAVWVGMVLGVWNRVEQGRARERSSARASPAKEPARDLGELGLFSDKGRGG